MRMRTPCSSSEVGVDTIPDRKNHENVLDTQLFMSYRARQHIANWWVNTKVQTACILRMTYIMDTMVTANTLSPPTTGSLATLGMTPYIL